MKPLLAAPQRDRRCGCRRYLTHFEPHHETSAPTPRFVTIHSRDTCRHWQTPIEPDDTHPDDVSAAPD